MVLIPTKDPAEAVLAMTLTTPRSAKRRAALTEAAANHPRTEPKRLTRQIFDPENQPRGQVGKWPEPEKKAVQVPVFPAKPCPFSRKVTGQVSGRFGFQLSDDPRGCFLGRTSISTRVYAVLFELCDSYGISAATLADGNGIETRQIRDEAFYTLMTACALPATEVARIMRRKQAGVLAGAHRHADRHGLPVLWRRGRQGASEKRGGL